MRCPSIRWPGIRDETIQLSTIEPAADPETDLPTRLRIEADAADAERQAARSHIELAAALSAWRQALGLLPR